MTLLVLVKGETEDKASVERPLHFPEIVAIMDILKLA